MNKGGNSFPVVGYHDGAVSNYRREMCELFSKYFDSVYIVSSLNSDGFRI